MKRFVSFVFVVVAWVAWSSPLGAQSPAGFGNTALDRKTPSGLSPSGGSSLIPSRLSPPTTPSLASSTNSTEPGIKLNGSWDSPNTLSRGGPQQQSKELHALLDGCANPGIDIGPDPAKRIYGNVTYLLPFADAQSRLGYTNKMMSGGKNASVGFPDGVQFVAFSAEAGRNFETRLLFDRAKQVVAVEYVAANVQNLPPPPVPLGAPKRELFGKTYDFVPQGISVAKEAKQLIWDLGDFVLIRTVGQPRCADLYLPKPMVSLILHCLQVQAAK